MSALPLSNVQEVIELTIFHSILQELVDKGYTPDVRDTIEYPDTPAGMVAYNNAKKGIIDTKGFTVDLFNNSNPDFKGGKNPPRIVIITEDPLPGDIGTDRGRVYEQIDGKFTPLIRPPDSYNIGFLIYLVADNAKEHRTLVSILANALPTKGYLPISPRYDLADFNIFVINTSSSLIPSAIDGVIERVYRYEVRDIFLTDYIAIFNPVSPLSQFTVNIQNIDKKLTELQMGIYSQIIPDGPLGGLD